MQDHEKLDNEHTPQCESALSRDRRELPSERAAGSCEEAGSRTPGGEEEHSADVEALCRSALEAGGAGLWFVDEEGKHFSGSALALKLFGLDAASHHDLAEVWSLVNPEDLVLVRQAFEQALHEGGECQVEFRVCLNGGSARWLWVQGSTVMSLSGKRLLGLVQDISERKERELHAQFLDHLTGRMLDIENPEYLLEMVSEATGRHLRASRCFFSEIDQDHSRALVHHDYHSSLPSLGGSYFLPHFSSSATIADMKAGRAVINPDARNDPRTAMRYHADYEPFGFGSYVAVPLRRNGRWVATFWISCLEPRTWKQEEVELVETVGARVWFAFEKTRLNAALHESEERFRVALMHAPITAFTQDHDLRYTWVSKTPPDLSLNQILGKREAELRAASHDAAVIEAVKLQALETNRPARQEVRVQTENGERYYDLCVEPLRDAGGTAVGVTGVAVDITDWRLAEKAVRENDRLFRTIMEFIPEGIDIVDAPEMKNRLTSAEARRILGCVSDEGPAAESREDLCTFLARTPLYHADGRILSIDELPLIRAMRTGEIIRNEELIVRQPCGLMVPLLCNAAPLCDEAGAVTGGIVVYRDISERKQAEQVLREREKKYRSLFESMTEGFALAEIINDEQGRPCDLRFLEVNPAYGKLTGLAPEKVVGRSAREFIPSIELEWIQNLGTSTLSGEAVSTRRYLPQTDKWIEAMAFSPGIGRFAVLLIDVTERTRMEKELRRSRDEAELLVEKRTLALRKSEEQLRHLSNELLRAHENERKRVANEIHDSAGQVLAAVKYRVESAVLKLKQAGLSNKIEPIQELIPLIQRCIEDMRRLQMDLRPSILDEMGIVATIGWFCREFKNTFAHIEVEQDISVEEHEVPMELKVVIFRIVQEALTNAGKHSEANRIRIFLKKTDDALVLTIEDNGHGFDVEEAGTIKAFGRGLGVSSMRERAEFSGGTLAIDSGSGKGTKIEVVWPSGVLR